MNNAERRRIVQEAKMNGYQGSYVDLFRQAAQNPEGMQKPLFTAVTSDQKEQGLRPLHEAGRTDASMAFPDVPPNTPFNTVGMKAPIDIKKYDKQGHLVKSYENVPPGIQNLDTGPNVGTVLETPSRMQEGGRLDEAMRLIREHNMKDDSTFENVVEMFDPTGISAWDDAYRAYKSMKARGSSTPNFDEGLDMLGAIPVMGKAKAAINLYKRSSKPIRYGLTQAYNKVLRHTGRAASIADGIEDETGFLDSKEQSKPVQRQGGGPVKEQAKPRIPQDTPIRSTESMNLDNDSTYNVRGWLAAGAPGGIDPGDGEFHGASVGNDGMWLKSKEHPTAWKEHLHSQLSLNPYFKKNMSVVNPEGYFGENQLQYVPRNKKQGGGYNPNEYMNEMQPKVFPNQQRDAKWVNYATQHDFAGRFPGETRTNREIGLERSNRNTVPLVPNLVRPKELKRAQEGAFASDNTRVSMPELQDQEAFNPYSYLHLPPSGRIDYSPVNVEDLLGVGQLIKPSRAVKRYFQEAVDEGRNAGIAFRRAQAQKEAVIRNERIAQKIDEGVDIGYDDIYKPIRAEFQQKLDMGYTNVRATPSGEISRSLQNRFAPLSKGPVNRFKGDISRFLDYDIPRLYRAEQNLFKRKLQRKADDALDEMIKFDRESGTYLNQIENLYRPSKGGSKSTGSISGPSAKEKLADDFFDRNLDAPGTVQNKRGGYIKLKRKRYK